jgi:predicted metal-dependent peptidase
VVRRATSAVGARALSGLPGIVRDAIRAAGESNASQIDWRRAIRIFGSSSRRTRIRTTLKRPSKRFGRIPGVKVQPLSHVAVAIDTSGSIGPEQLKDLFAEVRGIWRSGAEITVIECDDEIRKVWTYRGAVPDRCSGGGGTNFDPAIRWVNEHAARVDGLIYLTDGLGERSEACRRRVLWVVAGDRAGFEAMRSQVRSTELVIEMISKDR